MVPISGCHSSSLASILIRGFSFRHAGASEASAPRVLRHAMVALRSGRRLTHLWLQIVRLRIADAQTLNIGIVKAQSKLRNQRNYRQKNHSQMDHGQKNHSQMDHSQMDHGQRNHGQRNHGQRSCRQKGCKSETSSSKASSGK